MSCRTPSTYTDSTPAARNHGEMGTPIIKRGRVGIHRDIGVADPGRYFAIRIESQSPVIVFACLVRIDQPRISVPITFGTAARDRRFRHDRGGEITRVV